MDCIFHVSGRDGSCLPIFSTMTFTYCNTDFPAATINLTGSPPSLPFLWCQFLARKWAPTSVAVLFAFPLQPCSTARITQPLHAHRQHFPSQNVSLQHTGEHTGDGGGGPSLTSSGSFSGHRARAHGDPALVGWLPLARQSNLWPQDPTALRHSVMSASGNAKGLLIFTFHFQFFI